MTDVDTRLSAIQNPVSRVQCPRSAEPALQSELDAAAAAAASYREQAYAENTQRAYGADWKQFQTFCDRFGLPALPAAPEVVAAYLAREAQTGRRVSTIDRRAAVIRLAHLAGEHEPPTNAEIVRSVLRGIRRVHGGQVDKKAPVVAKQVIAMANAADTDSKTGLRDRALLRKRSVNPTGSLTTARR